jgi:hypothetical protein
MDQVPTWQDDFQPEQVVHPWASQADPAVEDVAHDTGVRRGRRDVDDAVGAVERVGELRLGHPRLHHGPPACEVYATNLIQAAQVERDHIVLGGFA